MEDMKWGLKIKCEARGILCIIIKYFVFEGCNQENRVYN